MRLDLIVFMFVSSYWLKIRSGRGILDVIYSVYLGLRLRLHLIVFIFVSRENDSQGLRLRLHLIVLIFFSRESDCQGD